MERQEFRPFSVDILIDDIQRELKDVFGAEIAARFVNSSEQDEIPDSAEVTRGENYSKWIQFWPRAKREVISFGGNSWQVINTFEDFDTSEGLINFRTVVSKDPSGNITVEGHLPIKIIQEFLFETARGKVSRYQSLLQETLHDRYMSYFEPYNTKHYSLRCKFVSNDIEASYIAFPLTD